MSLRLNEKNNADLDFFQQIFTRIRKESDKAALYGATGSVLGQALGILVKVSEIDIPTVTSLLPSATFGVFLSAAISSAIGYGVGSVRELQRLRQEENSTKPS
jgi:hypothetical protein